MNVDFDALAEALIGFMKPDDMLEFLPDAVRAFYDETEVIFKSSEDEAHINLSDLAWGLTSNVALGDLMNIPLPVTLVSRAEMFDAKLAVLDRLPFNRYFQLWRHPSHNGGRFSADLTLVGWIFDGDTGRSIADHDLPFYLRHLFKFCGAH